MSKNKLISEEIREGIARELHAPVRRKFNRRRVTVKGLADLMQADLIDVRKYSRENQGNTYILVVIDAFTKYAYAEGVKRKSGPAVAEAFEKILRRMKKSDIPKNLQTDQGLEFFNSHCARVFSEYGINHYVTYSSIKASIAERFIRTLKNMLWKHFTARSTFKWSDILQKCVNEYNQTKHRSIGMAPREVNASNAAEVLKKLRKLAQSRKQYRTLEIGTAVRISKAKACFKKGYTPNYSSEVFKIKEVQATDPPTYLLEDLSGEAVLGAFYREELLPTKYSDIFLASKVYKRSRYGGQDTGVQVIHMPDFGKSYRIGG
jgi:Integrase core domain